jgi:hypothetical protein
MQYRPMLQFDHHEYNIKLLLATPVFQDIITTLREKHHIPKEGFTNHSEKYEWQERLSQQEKRVINEAIDSLIQRLKLSDRWHEPIILYLTTNNPMFLRATSRFELKYDHDEESSHPTNLKTTWIRVDADTTQREVLAAYEAAKGHFPIRPKKQQNRNTDRDLSVLGFHNQGWSNKKIAKWLNDNHPGSFNTDDVAKIIMRIQKKLEK